MAGTISATIKINDAFSGALSKLKSGLGSSATAMNQLKNNASGASGGGMFKQFLGANVIGAGITKAVSAVGTGLRSMYGELDESSRAWQTFNGNMAMIGQGPKQIASTRGDLQKFAQETIYSASDMASTYSQLAAVGTKGTKRLVKGFGGLAAASSDPQQAMKTLSQQATQAAAKPKIQWMDFKLMLEQTPAGMAAVAKTMHRSTGQLVKDVQDGKVKTQDFFDAVAKTGTNKNFSKMATQYKTVGQAMDGLKETLANKMQPAFDKVSKVGIKAISGITDKIGTVNFDGLADGLLGLGPKIMAAVQPLKAVAPFVIGIVGAFAGLSAVSGILTGVAGAFTSISTAVTGFGTKLLAIPAQIAGVFSAIGGVFSALSAPIVVALAVVTVAIAAAVYAWQSNFMGVRDFISAAFSGIGSVFAPLVGAFNQLKSALSPIVSALLPSLAQALGMIGVGTIVAVALGFAVLTDAMTIFISIGAAVVHAVMAVVHGMTALNQAMHGDFSGASNSLKSAKNDISGIGDALSRLGEQSNTQKVLGALDQIGSKATSTKSKVSDIQIKPKVDTSNVFAQMDSLTAGKTAKVNVKPEIQAGANPFQTIQAQADSHPVKTKAQVDTTGVGNPLKQLQSQASANPIKAKVQADTSSTADPFQQIKSKAASTTIKPKVETPKVPTPTMPKGQTMHVKVATPKIPTPTRPASMPTLHVKVATPKIPAPTKPTMPTIAAPHVMRPSMAGVVSAVASGMRGAAATARQGGAGISAAVRSSIAQAVAAARAGAGAMRSAGAMIGAGLAGGMRSQVGAVAAAANALVAQADRAARAAAKIHSPSRVFAEIGDYMGQGMAVGMNGTSSLVAGAGATMAHSAVGGARGAMMPGVNPNASTPSHSPFVRKMASGSSTTNATTTNSNQQNDGTHVTFATGAIQIQSTGNADYDGERIAAALESHLINLKERRG